MLKYLLLKMQIIGMGSKAAPPPKKKIYSEYLILTHYGTASCPLGINSDYLLQPVSWASQVTITSNLHVLNSTELH